MGNEEAGGPEYAMNIVDESRKVSDVLEDLISMDRVKF
jgi:hypothetical protein